MNTNSPMPGNSRFGDTVPNNVAPGNMMSGNAAPNNLMPGNMMSDNTTPNNVMPDNAGFSMKGTFPSDPVLGMAYVLFQNPGLSMYPETKGLKRGTMYEALDYPFHNNPNSGVLEETPLNMVMAAGFALVDLGLYLDTHPDDAETIAIYNKYYDSYVKRKAAYEKTYGPLTKGKVEGQFYNWVKDPWPWDMK